MGSARSQRRLGISGVTISRMPLRVQARRQAEATNVAATSNSRALGESGSGRIGRLQGATVMPGLRETVRGSSMRGVAGIRCRHPHPATPQWCWARIRQPLAPAWVITSLSDRFL